MKMGGFFAPKKLEKMKEEEEDEVFTLSYYTSGSDGYFMLCRDSTSYLFSESGLKCKLTNQCTLP